MSLVFSSLASAQSSCSNPSPLPAGYASPCPVFSVSPASVSQTQTLTLSATPQPGTDYIYTTAYYAKGSTWLATTLTGNNAAPSYSFGPAAGSLPASILSTLTPGTNYIVLWDWLWDATARCYKGPGLNQCNTGQWRVQSFSLTLLTTPTPTPTPGITINVKNLPYNAKGDGVTDDTQAINSAIAALQSGDTLLFPAGTYEVTGDIHLDNKNNFIVDGSNGAATINLNGNTNAIYVGQSGCGEDYNNRNFTGSCIGPAIQLSATASELSTSFTTVSSLGVAPGDFILIEEGGIFGNTSAAHDYPNNNALTSVANVTDPTLCDTGSGCRGEFLQVQGVSGNTVTVATALHNTYTTANLTLVRKLTHIVSGFTIQNINIHSVDGNSGGMYLFDVVNGTLQNVSITHARNFALETQFSYGMTYKNLTLSAANPNPNNWATFGLYSHGHAIINGITATLGGVFIVEGSDDTITNLSVDYQGISAGRPLKLGTLAYDVFNGLVSKNSVGAFNGMSLEFYNHNNAFNNCVITGHQAADGSGGAGVAVWGNFETYNSWNNCTITGNGNVQWVDGAWAGTNPAIGGKDTGNEISGGTIHGGDGGEPPLMIEGGVGDYIHNATISGPGPQGIVIYQVNTGGTNTCVNTNTFISGSGSTALGSAISSNSATNKGSGNSLNGLSSNLTAGACP